MYNTRPFPPVARHSLLDQQLWYLGRDIGADAGNGLIRFGFRRLRSASGCGTSCYLLDAPAAGTVGVPPHPRVLCWGFALFIGDALLPDESLPSAPLRRHGSMVRGILLERFRTRPRLTRVPLLLPIHQPAQLARFESPRDADDQAAVHALLHDLARVMARYEQWAIRTLGAVHRRSALADVPRHKRHRFAPSAELSADWLSLSFDASYGDAACAADGERDGAADRGGAM